MGETFLFRETRPGEYWPPVLLRGRFSAKPVGAKKILDLSGLAEEGLRCEGIRFGWEEIQGMSVVGDIAQLMNCKYISGGLRFHISTCSLIDGSGSIYRLIHGGCRS